jgi:hypothetical protein
MSEWNQALQTECALRCGDFGDPACWQVDRKVKPCRKCLRACGLLPAIKRRLPMKEDDKQ